jgi:hypothetical protein
MDIYIGNLNCFVEQVPYLFCEARLKWSRGDQHAFEAYIIINIYAFNAAKRAGSPQSSWYLVRLGRAVCRQA